METLSATEDTQVAPTEGTVEIEAVKVDTDSIRERAGETIRQVGGILVIRPTIRGKRYRQGV